MNKMALVTIAMLFVLTHKTGYAQIKMNEIDANTEKGRNLIQVALPEFLRKGLSPEGYKIVLFDDENGPVVVFEDEHKPSGQRGSAPGKRSFAVELSTDGSKVIRAYFVR